MKYILCLILFTFTFSLSEAQFLVHFKLGSSPRTHSNDSIFIAGNFNNWEPGNSAYSFPAGNAGAVSFYAKLPAGFYEYKSTRGNWAKVESLNYGEDVDNHDFEITRDTTIIINIEAWKDDFATVAKKHTASNQVHIIDTAFFIPQLNRNRKIWIYLPHDYQKTKKRYPVLYMHDGQNLFDAATASYGEWGVDECLDSLISSGKQACIVVGIESGPRRFNEYNPYEFQDYGKGEAEQYLDFLVETLEQYVDKKYRTLPDKENTIIAGSSMGGLVSYYAMLKRPEVFGKAGIFSPAFWTAPAITHLTDSLAPKINGKFFFYMGQKEGDSFVNDMLQIQELLGEKSSAMIYSVTDPAGRHNEKAWRKWMAEFYTWMMADGYNTVIKVDK